MGVDVTELFTSTNPLVSSGLMRVAIKDEHSLKIYDQAKTVLPHIS